MSEAQTVLPNPSDFSINEREGKFTAMFRVTGTIRFEIDADSVADARAKARADASRILDSGETDIDDMETVEVDHVYKNPAMYRVLREGKKMQVSRLEPGDIPREPDDRGF